MGSQMNNDLFIYLQETANLHPASSLNLRIPNLTNVTHIILKALVDQLQDKHPLFSLHLDFNKNDDTSRVFL